jgi:hypothetical protein
LSPLLFQSLLLHRSREFQLVLHAAPILHVAPIMFVWVDRQEAPISQPLCRQPLVAGPDWLEGDDPQAVLYQTAG